MMLEKEAGSKMAQEGTHGKLHEHWTGPFRASVTR